MYICICIYEKVCIYIYMNIFRHIHIYRYNIYIYVCTYLHIYINNLYIYIYIYTYIYIHIYVYINICIYFCICLYDMSCMHWSFYCTCSFLALIYVTRPLSNLARRSEHMTSPSAFPFVRRMFASDVPTISTSDGKGGESNK